MASWPDFLQAICSNPVTTPNPRLFLIAIELDPHLSIGGLVNLPKFTTHLRGGVFFSWMSGHIGE